MSGFLNWLRGWMPVTRKRMVSELEQARQRHEKNKLSSDQALRNKYKADLAKEKSRIDEWIGKWSRIDFRREPSGEYAVMLRFNPQAV